MSLIGELMGVPRDGGRRPPARLRPATSEVMRLRCDNTKLEHATGFRPESRCAEGLARTVDWFRDPANLGRYKTRSLQCLTARSSWPAGRARGLRPYTVVLPKPLMPIGDYPILEIIVRQLAVDGFDHITHGGEPSGQPDQGVLRRRRAVECQHRLLARITAAQHHRSAVADSTICPRRSC